MQFNELANYDQLLLMDNTHAYSGRFLCRQTLILQDFCPDINLIFISLSSASGILQSVGTVTVEEERTPAEPRIIAIFSWCVYMYIYSMGGTHQERRRTTASSTASG